MKIKLFLAVTIVATLSLSIYAINRSANYASLTPQQRENIEVLTCSCEASSYSQCYKATPTSHCWVAEANGNGDVRCTDNTGHYYPHACK